VVENSVHNAQGEPDGAQAWAPRWRARRSCEGPPKLKMVFAFYCSHQPLIEWKGIDGKLINVKAPLNESS